MVAVAGVDRETAADLAQDVLVKVLRSFPDGSAPLPWLYAVARNRLTDWLRAEARSRARRLPADEQTLAGAAPDPAEAIDRREARRRVGRYLDALPPREREVAFLRFFEGMRHRQIALITGLPAGTVKYLVHQVRQGVRSTLEVRDDG
jgi:RNA polymerase sigma factor (sigma-70 family)